MKEEPILSEEEFLSDLGELISGHFNLPIQPRMENTLQAAGLDSLHVEMIMMALEKRYRIPEDRCPILKSRNTKMKFSEIYEKILECGVNKNGK